VKQRPKRSVDRLRHSSSSCECASPARSAFYFIGSSFGISYEKIKNAQAIFMPGHIHFFSLFHSAFYPSATSSAIIRDYDPGK
ncbi:MAG: hypothetical protein UD035_02730, partial [Coprococcus comes]|nr:hypothetical protein [Coprococcus comes]